MQKVASYNVRSHAHLPLLDLTNTFSNHLPTSSFLATSRYYNKEFISKTTASSCNASLYRCSHIDRLPSMDHTSNCITCGAFIVQDGVYGIVGESHSPTLSVSPSTILSNMLKKQHLNRATYRDLPPTLVLIRKRTVEWICETGEMLKISIECIHKAVALLDRVFSERALEETEAQQTALICLLLSAKLIETDEIIDHIKSLFKTRFGIKGQQLKRKESQALTFLRWDLQCVTPLDFIQLFTAQGVVFTSDLVKTAKGERAASLRVAESVKKYTEFFADMCLQRHTLLSFSPVQLACGIIAVSRKQMQLTRMWNSEIELLTGMKFADIEKCVATIEKYYGKLFPKTGKSMEIPRSQAKYVGYGKENVWSGISGARTSRVPSSLAMYSVMDIKYAK